MFRPVNFNFYKPKTICLHQKKCFCTFDEYKQKGHLISFDNLEKMYIKGNLSEKTKILDYVIENNYNDHIFMNTITVVREIDSLLYYLGKTFNNIKDKKITEQLVKKIITKKLDRNTLITHSKIITNLLLTYPQYINQLPDIDVSIPIIMSILEKYPLLKLDKKFITEKTLEISLTQFDPNKVNQYIEQNMCSTLVESKEHYENYLRRCYSTKTLAHLFLNQKIPNEYQTFAFLRFNNINRLKFHMYNFLMIVIIIESYIYLYY